MTSSLLADQVVAINQKLADFASSRVSYVAGVVTSVDTVNNTFGANILQPDTTSTVVSGIRSSAQFMPFVGDTVTLALSGPQIIYLPNGVAGGSIGSIQLAGDVNTSISDASTNASNALAAVNGKITSYYQTSPPSGANTGDFWIDTDDKNKLYRWNGSAWVQIQDQQIQDALTQAGTAQATADGKVQTFYRGTAPTNPTDNIGTGDLWFDTANGNKGYRWSGSAWVIIQDTSISAALSTANVALTTGSNSVPDPSFENSFRTLTAPWSIDATTAHTGTKSAKCVVGSVTQALLTPQPIAVLPGQVWRASAWRKTDASYNGTSTNGKLRVGNQANAQVAAQAWTQGTTWTQVLLTYTVPSDGSVSALQVQMVNDHTAGTLWVDDVELVNITDALNALNVANEKITSYYATTAPSGANTGDFWVDTGHQNKLYRWSGTAWVVVQDQQIQDALTQAGTAQATADGKMRIFAQTTAPAGETSGDVGDLWYDTDDGNKPYTWSGSAWVARPAGTSAIATGAIDNTLLQAVLSLSTTISAGAPSSTRIQLTSAGLTSYVVTGGVSTQTGSYTTTSGAWQMQGQMKSVGTNGRTVILDGQIDTASGGGGKAVGEAGLVWQSTDANQTRYGQFYHATATGALSMDSPAFSTTLGDGIARYGSTVQTDARGVYGFTEADGTHPALLVRNDGFCSLGRVGIASRNALTMDSATWKIASGTSGRSTVWGDANDAHLSNPGGGTGCDMNADGTWAMGHATGQNVYSDGSANKLVLRDRQVAVASGINAFTAPGSWFDMWPSYSGATQGGVFVHGDFGATTKSFVIDHPIDEDRKLVHGCTESPQGGLQYWGTATLNDEGEAEVSLPSYFEALAYPDRRNVQVTLIGKPAPVGADRPKDGKFKVYGPPGRDVDWLVHGARRGVDFVVEPLKTEWRPDHDELPEWQPEKVSKKLAAAGANRRGRQGAWKPNPLPQVKPAPDMDPKHLHIPPRPPHPSVDHSSIQGIKPGQTARPTHD